MDKVSDNAAPRFHVSAHLSAGAEIDLPDRAARHVSVLRLRQGDAITLFNGEGGEYSAVLTQLSKSQASARITAWRPIERESALEVTLAQCISSGDRMDTTLQKATELGVKAIVPLESERSVVRLSSDRVEKRLLHWRNVTLAACEQCGRNQPPIVANVERLHAWLMAIQLEEKLAVESPATRVLLAPDATHGFGSLPRSSSILLLVGPEGGLAPHERAAAYKAGFLPVRLGPRTLRTETAPLAALSALQALWGDLV
jgi:16S rRNA (uracil1498-N3)-methyltransferase